MASLDLQLLSLKDQLNIRNIDGSSFIFDPVRRKNILVQPEEYVRQLMVVWLHTIVGIPYGLMAVEKRIKFQEGYKRFDIVCYNRDMKPQILVECKAFDFNLSEATAMQIAIYNHQLLCPHLIITNGKETLAFDIDANGNIDTISDLKSYIALLNI